MAAGAAGPCWIFRTQNQTAATAAGAGDKLSVPNMGNQVQAVDLKKNDVLWSYEAEKRSQPFYSSAAVTEVSGWATRSCWSPCPRSWSV